MVLDRMSAKVDSDIIGRMSGKMYYGVTLFYRQNVCFYVECLGSAIFLKAGKTLFMIWAISPET